MLRTLHELRGFQLDAVDGLVGHVTDVCFDEHWSIRCLVVDTGSGHDKLAVRVSPSRLSGADGEMRTLTTPLTMKQVTRQHESDRSAHHSAHQLIGYHLRATDDTVGHVEDVIIDDATWTIRYLAVDTSHWIGGHVLISPGWIRAVRWPEHEVELVVMRDVVEHSPRWSHGLSITKNYEDRLREYYRLRQAWSVDGRSNDGRQESP